MSPTKTTAREETVESREELQLPFIAIAFDFHLYHPIDKLVATQNEDGRRTEARKTRILEDVESPVRIHKTKMQRGRRCKKRYKQNRRRHEK